MKIRRIVNDKDIEGSRLPSWYGIAFRDYECRRTYLYIIPLNLIVRYAFKLHWLIFRWLKYDDYEKRLRYAESRGFNNGYELGSKFSESMMRRLIEEKK